MQTTGNNKVINNLKLFTSSVSAVKKIGMPKNITYISTLSPYTRCPPKILFSRSVLTKTQIFLFLLVHSSQSRRKYRCFSRCKTLKKLDSKSITRNYMYKYMNADYKLGPDTVQKKIFFL